MEAAATTGTGAAEGEAGEKLRNLKQRAWRATLVARQLVPPGEEEEEGPYCEHELANMLMGECRNLGPGYDQLWRQPIKDERFRWSYQEAAQVG